MPSWPDSRIDVPTQAIDELVAVNQQHARSHTMTSGTMLERICGMKTLSRRAYTRVVVGPAVMETLKARFDAAHQAGLAALEAGDFRRLGEAIREERAIIDEQRRVVEAHLRRQARRRR